MKNISKNGFTLIELLVVVLIIGILASVALPQYTKAVEKTRIMRLLPNLRYLKNEIELYYMANGAYPDDAMTNMDVEITGCRYTGGGNFQCGDYGFDYNGYPPHAHASILACVGTTVCQAGYKTAVTWYMDYDSYAGKKTCTSTISGLCNSLKGSFLDN